jgi:hypothetical protein
MAVSNYDKAFLYSPDLDELQRLTEAWEKANEAEDDDAKALIHQSAENIRAKYGYSGDKDGSGLISGLGPKSIEDYRTRLARAQLQQQMNALAGEYEKNLSNLGESYAGARDDASVNLARNRAAWNEAAAARGFAAGTSALAGQRRNNVYDNQLLQLDKSETKARDELTDQYLKQKEQYNYQLASL